jgi:NADH dehydrogenase
MFPTKILIIGGGIGGVATAKALTKANAEVWLIEKTNHSLFNSLINNVATSNIPPHLIATPLRKIFEKNKNINILMGEVIKIEKDKKTIVLKNNDRLGYDYLIIAEENLPDYTEPWEKNALCLTTIQDATKIREKIFHSLEKAERCKRLQETKKSLIFVIIGGGIKGVGFAGILGESLSKNLLKNFKKTSKINIRIYLIENNSDILSTYPKKLIKKATEFLKKNNIQILKDKKITNICNDKIYLNDSIIE